MFTLEEALELIGQLATDTPPVLSSTQLGEARDVIARAVHAARTVETPDWDALLTLRDAYTAADTAYGLAVEREETERQELEAALGDIPNPDPADTGGGDLETEDVVQEPAEEPAAAGGRSYTMLSPAEAAARLAALNPNPGGDDADSRTEVREPSLTMTATLDGRTVEDPSTLTLHDLASAFANTSRRGRTAGRMNIVQFQSRFSPDRTLPGTTAEENTRFIDDLMSPEAVTAAGGCCALPEVIYDIPVSGSTARPIRDALNPMSASRGAVQFYPPLCGDAGGVGLWTCEQDELVDPDDPDTWKQCYDVECEDPITVAVEAIYACVTIGNFQVRFSPERWASVLRKVSVEQARLAEVALFQKMRAGATTTHTGDATGSFYLNLLNSLERAGAAIRQDQRLEEVRLNTVLPSWVPRAVAADLRARRLGVDNIESARTLLTTQLAADNIVPTWSPDVQPIEPDGQTDGPISAWPSVAPTVLFPDGYFTFLDGGTLDMGTDIRDHELNRKNQLAAFSESFEGLLARGCNAKNIDIPVEVCDTTLCPGDVPPGP